MGRHTVPGRGVSFTVTTNRSVKLQSSDVDSVLSDSAVSSVTSYFAPYWPTGEEKVSSIILVVDYRS